MGSAVFRGGSGRVAERNSKQPFDQTLPEWRIEHAPYMTQKVNGDRCDES